MGPPNQLLTSGCNYLCVDELGRDIDRFLDALGDRAACGVVRMRAVGRLAFVIRAAAQRVAHANRLDDEHLVDDVDVALCLRAESPSARIDPARLQRATQGPGESTGGGGHDVIEGRRVFGVLARSRALVLAHLIVRSEYDGLRLGRKVRLADRAAISDNPHPGDVTRPVL